MDFQEAIDRRIREYEENQGLPEKDAKGNAFEDLTQIYIQTTWRSLGAKVWKWREEGNPLNPEMKGDSGCDLVVKTRDGNLYMVQCKNHSESTLTKDGAHLSNIFQLAAENDIPKERVIFAYIAKGISNYAEDTLETAGICIDEEDFDSIDWAPFFEKGKKAEGKHLRPYQKEAVEACREGFKAEEEEGKPQVGKLIMACGTGKTFTSLSLVKELSQAAPYNVLFLAPSIALVAQTFREWTNEEDIASVVVCSDSTASKKKRGNDDEIDERLQDVPFPVSTDSDKISQSWKIALESDYGLHVVFSTYQSLEAVHEFQEKSGVRFDLTICDEAHRTATEEGSLFAKAVDPDYIETQKKLFMTATPKIYCDTRAARKQKGSKGEEDREERPEFYSMDDEEKYGPEFFRFGFGEAVDQGWLCDYRVLILAMRQRGVNPKIQDVISGTEAAKEERQALIKKLDGKKKEESRRAAQTKLDEFENELSTLAGKIQGAYIDLSDLEASNQGEVGKAFDDLVSFREVGPGAGFDSSDSKEPHFAHSAIGFASKINTSKIIKQTFSDPAFPAIGPKIECRHIDGETRSDRRLKDLSWLKQGEKSDEIRLITNAQCLSEGVDVPALDAVVFFEKKVSQIGIIQAVGRVMRKAPGKEFGYIILPVILQDAQDPKGALEKNEDFARIWEILQNMRSVDERLDAKINTLYLSRKTGRLKSVKEKQAEDSEAPQQAELPLGFDEQLQRSLVSFILSKCGSSMYWNDWVSNISGSVQNMINEIDELADSPEIKPKFEAFVGNLSKTLHKEQTKEDAVNLIAQFIVTRPVFSDLFPASDFDSNPISRALESIADDFKDAYSAYDRELVELKFSMKQAVKAAAESPAARKRLVKKFYEQFYQKVFPKEADANGVVYTPEPVVDFMIKETDRLLQRNFGKKLQDEGIQILDPFSGTGTFVTRLLDKDLGAIDDDHIKEKYQKEIWSNEIMPTAYYISTLNIEDAMKQRTGEARPFPGAVLTDTFRIDEATAMLDPMFSGNNERENKENIEKISVIISNPPYDTNQGDARKNNPHAHYEVLDKRINDTYGKKTINSDYIQYLHDSYIRAFRWASDRIKSKGIVALITNAGWMTAIAAEGMRKCFIDEFNDIYVYDLKGHCGRYCNDPKEGKNIFRDKCTNAVAITFLVKSPDSDHTGQIHYISVPNYLETDDKLVIMEEAKNKEPEWESLQMDEFGDWLDKRDKSFYSLVPMGWKKYRKTIPGIFNLCAQGVKTNKNAWLYSFSEEDLQKNLTIFTSTFNKEFLKWKEYRAEGGRGQAEDVAKNVVNQDPTKIKWNEETYKLLDKVYSRKEPYPLKVNSAYIRTAIFYPYTKKCLYFYDPLINRTYEQEDIFPEANSSNLELCVSGKGAHSFSCLMTDKIPNIDLLSKTYCYPLQRYQENGLGEKYYEKRSAIADQALKMFREVYEDEDILSPDTDKAKEQIFYYVYGLLHSKEYREKYQDNLSKDLPRIPFSSHFKEFEKAGRELAAFHVGYEEAPKCEDVLQVGEPEGEISKMRLDKDRGALTVNRYLSFKNIPKEAFEYVVNGKSPLEWVVNQYQITVDKDTPKAKGSQIVSNPNDSPISDIYYVADLIPRLVTVSLKTQEIVNSLPRIDRLTSMDSEIERIWGVRYTAEGAIKS